jgi:pimeloyl-ACP methyl ester carboxylesterase
VDVTATSQMQTFHVHGVDLAWSERGSGEPAFVLCHGYTGSSHDWALQVDELARRRRVVTYDHRGHGSSTKVGSLEGYTISQLADDTAAFLDAVGAGPVDLLGHSMGGRVVMTMVLQRPDLVRSLILMDTSAWSFQPPDEELRTLVQQFIQAFDPAGGMPSNFSLEGPEDKLIEATVPPEWKREKDGITAGMDAYAVKGLGVELWADAADGPGSLRSRLAEITCPVTVIVGAHDHPLVDQGPALTAELADGHLVIIEGAYHSPQLTHPDEWRAAVEAHLARFGA